MYTCIQGMIECGVHKHSTFDFFYIRLYCSKVWGQYNFLHVFEKKRLFCSPRLHLFDQKYNKDGSVVKYYYNLK